MIEKKSILIELENGLVTKEPTEMSVQLFSLTTHINNVTSRQISYNKDSFTTKPFGKIFGGLLCPSVRTICQYQSWLQHMFELVYDLGHTFFSLAFPLFEISKKKNFMLWNLKVFFHVLFSSSCNTCMFIARNHLV